MGAGQDHPEWQGVLDDQEHILWQARPFGGFLNGIRNHRLLWVWAVALLTLGIGIYAVPPFATVPEALREETVLRLVALGLFALIWVAAAAHIGIRHASRFYTLTSSHAYIGDARLITMDNLGVLPYVELEKSLNYYEFKPDTEFRIETMSRKGRIVQHLFAANVTDQNGKIYDSEVCLFHNAPADHALGPIIHRVTQSHING